MVRMVMGELRDVYEMVVDFEVLEPRWQGATQRVCDAAYRIVFAQGFEPARLLGLIEPFSTTRQAVTLGYGHK
jgi:hypothetical protein